MSFSEWNSKVLINLFLACIIVIIIISYQSVLTCALGTQKNRLNEMVLLSNHNICFG